MKISLRNALTLAAVALAAGLLAPVHAQVASYGFESPVFTVGQSTALLAEPPNGGDATFLTDFTSSPGAADFSVFAFSSGLQPAFSGQFLSSTGGRYRLWR